MKKHIRYISRFVAILLLMLYALQYTIDYCYKKRATNKYAQVLNHKLDPDMMIFGPSTALKHFDPAIIKKITGLSSWNMGYDGMFFLQYNALIREYLEYEKNCKYIVIGCNPFLGKDWIIMRPDFFYAYLDRKNVFNALVQIEHNKIFHARYLPGYKLTLLNKSFYWEMIHASGKPDPQCGYEPVTDSGHNFNNITTPFNEECDEQVFNTLQSTIAAITQKGIKVILVMPPIYERGYKLISNIRFIISKYRSLEAENVFFLDYTKDSMCKNASYFNNNMHLNITGATLFSYTFAHDLGTIKK